MSHVKRSTKPESTSLSAWQVHLWCMLGRIDSPCKPGNQQIRDGAKDLVFADMRQASQGS